MKKLMYTLVFAIVASFAITACTEENIRPQDGGGSNGGDQCQFGGPGCQ